jgi:hypothetical protein
MKTKKVPVILGVLIFLGTFMPGVSHSASPALKEHDRDPFIIPHSELDLLKRSLE